MGSRVALVSGGKDSFYAAMLERPVDYAVVLVYEFPRPSPHLVNLGLSVRTLLNAGYRVVVARLRRGRERVETVELLRRLGASVVIAGDVYIEDHLRYMEGVAADAGATLREPLWGMDPEELLYREVEAGIEALITGSIPELRAWIGRLLDARSAGSLAEEARRLGVDPLGERGEYHTLVVNSPLHEEPVRARVARLLEYRDYLVALLEEEPREPRV